MKINVYVPEPWRRPPAVVTLALSPQEFAAILACVGSTSATDRVGLAQTFFGIRLTALEAEFDYAAMRDALMQLKADGAV